MHLSICYLDKYYVHGVLGQGAFGKVLDVERLDHQDNKRNPRLAMKVIRDVSKYREDAKEEARILRKLHRHATSPYCVDLRDIFPMKHRGRKHMCLLFDALGDSLYEFIKANGRRGFRIGDVEAIGFQLLKAVCLRYVYNMYIRYISSDQLIHSSCSFGGVNIYV